MKFCDLSLQYNTYKSEIDHAISEVLQSSQFINGSSIQTLEKELSDYVGVKHAITCSSGTDALLLSLMAKGIEPGDEVICPAFSFIASASMISLLGATPIFVDIAPTDYNIDVTQIEAHITSRTKGIIAVSLYGQCPDMDAINTIANRHGLFVIEDAAQSFGASYKGLKSCALSELAVTSFFPAKPLGCYGDGGAIFTNNDQLANNLRMLRSHGQTQRYRHEKIGINGRMDTIQASILSVKLKHFDQEVKNRQEAAQLYSEIIGDAVLLPEILEERSSVWAQYTIAVENRDQLINALTKKGIPTSIHYPTPLPMQKAFDGHPQQMASYKISELLSETVVSLPMHGLISKDEVEFVAETVVNALK